MEANSLDLENIDKLYEEAEPFKEDSDEDTDDFVHEKRRLEKERNETNFLTEQEKLLRLKKMEVEAKYVEAKKGLQQEKEEQRNADNWVTKTDDAFA